MEIGFIPEATVGGFLVTAWHPGDATTAKATWAERVASPGGIRYAREKGLAIDAYRCTTCGRLELFAMEPWSSGLLRDQGRDVAEVVEAAHECHGDPGIP